MLLGVISFPPHRLCIVSVPEEEGSQGGVAPGATAGQCGAVQSSGAHHTQLHPAAHRWVLPSAKQTLTCRLVQSGSSCGSSQIKTATD